MQVYAPTTNVKEAEAEQFYEDLADLPEVTPRKKRCSFHHRVLECKSFWCPSKATLSNRQVWPWSTKWSRAKANRVLPIECTGHSKHPLPTMQETTLHMDITRWSMSQSDWLYYLHPKMDKLCQSEKIRPWADCGSDHKLLIVKWRLKLKTLGKTTRSPSQSVFSVALSCLTFCDPMDCSMQGFPVHHQLLELTQTHVHSVGVAIESVMPPSSVVPFSSCPQSFPATESFLMG